ncbi:MAG: VOC family protein [Thermoplasmatota archaeon]
MRVASAMLSLYDIAIVVSDPKASAKFFREKVGLDVVDDDGHWVTVGTKGAPTVIHLCAASERNKVDPGNTGLGFTAANVEKTCHELAARGVKFAHPYAKTQWGERAVFLDLDGNEFTIMNE